MCSIPFPPNMIWDNHEIGDGWGSHYLADGGPDEGLARILPDLAERGQATIHSPGVH